MIVHARKPKRRTEAQTHDSGSAKPIATIVRARAPNKLHKDPYLAASAR
jgi:hypothetical protein